MEKDKLRQIASLLFDGCSYKSVNAEGIIPKAKRTLVIDGTACIMKYLTVSVDLDGNVRVYLYDGRNEMEPELTDEETDFLIDELKRKKVYIVITESSCDFDQSSEIKIVTQDYIKAERIFTREAADIKLWVEENDYEIEESGNSVCAYEPGSAAKEHEYVFLHTEFLE